MRRRQFESSQADKTDAVPKPPRMTGKMPCFDWINKSCSVTDCPRPHQYTNGVTAAQKAALKVWIAANKVTPT